MGPRTVGPCLVLGTQEAGLRRIRRLGSSGVEPRRAWVPSSMPRMVILILPVLLGVRPGTFGSGYAAPSFTVQANSVGCKHRQRVHRRLYAVAGVHRGPLAFIYGHEITSVTYVTSR